jgi:NADPH:quinone reductase-like Zn-dependent oxidoreductase
MRAVVYRCYGGPEVRELTELPEPKTHVDSVLIRVRTVGLNRAGPALQAGALDSAVGRFGLGYVSGVRPAGDTLRRVSRGAEGGCVRSVVRGSCAVQRRQLISMPSSTGKVTLW